MSGPLDLQDINYQPMEAVRDDGSTLLSAQTNNSAGGSVDDYEKIKSVLIVAVVRFRRWRTVASFRNYKGWSARYWGSGNVMASAKTGRKLQEFTELFATGGKDVHLTIHLTIPKSYLGGSTLQLGKILF